MNSQELNGKSLALLLAGEDEDWSVLRGTVRQQGDVVLLDHSAGGEPFHIQPEWLDRIQPIPEDLSDILMNADFFLPLSVGTLPEGDDPSDYKFTGLKLSG